MAMQSSHYKPYVITAAACFGLLFLACSIFFIKVFLGTQIQQTQTSNVNTVATTNNNTSNVPLPDPLVTLVPEDQTSPESKSKVFVSSFDPLLGSTQAKVYVVIFGSFYDPQAEAYIDMAQTIYKAYGDDVAIVWKDYVPDNNERAVMMATIGHCAQEQGKFWELADLYSERTTDDDASLYALASSLGMLQVDLQDCVEQSGYQAQVKYGYTYGKSLQVTNSHTVFVNDHMFTDVVSQEELTNTIDDILATY